MIRRSPCELYLKYLLVHPDRYNNDQVRKICRLQQLDVVGEDYLDRLRTKLVKPIPFYPLDEYHERSRRFLLKHRILRLFYPDESMKLATELLEQARAKELIESFILSKAEPLWIASALGKQGYDATPSSIEYYKRFYFNIDLVDRTEALALLRLRVVGEPGDPEQSGEFSAMYKSMGGDPRIAAAEAPIPAMAMLMNTLRMGFMPNNADLSKMAAVGRAGAVLQGTNAVMRGGYKDHERARDFALTAKAFHELIESVGSPEEDLQQQLTSLMLQTDTKPPPSIHELTDGHHTTELQPIAESDHAEQ